ncbi:hypothetical protein C2E23DRAFT_302237 [Lenzites betulinus]|nr:hypothetical protein C2E23DRAFT_302237 [Lenzites betulinus]
MSASKPPTRDIAEHTQCGNFMSPRNDNGTMCGVLNDRRDLAGDASSPKLQTHAASFEVTGMAPFMAIDLLTNAARRGEVRHLYRHDLESLFWIFIWVVSCVEDGRQIDPLPEIYERWTSSDMTTCRTIKREFLWVGWEYSGGGPRPTWSAEGKLARAVLYHFFDTQHARDSQVRHRKNMVEEVDVPEKVWRDFCAVIREVSGAHPSMGYLVDI